MKKLLNRFYDLILDYQALRFVRYEILKLLTGYNQHNYPWTATKRASRGFGIICKDPYIVFTTERTSEIEVFSEELKDHKAYFFVIFATTLFSEPHRIRQLKDSYYKQIARFPDHKIIFLCNTKQELDSVKPFCKDAHFINQNALLDENIYKIIQSDKDLEVVYNGRLNRSKRHYLIPNKYRLGLISASIINLKKERNYLKQLKNQIPNALIQNFNPERRLAEMDDQSFDSIPFLIENEVVKALNRSKVGVILSSFEGANYASMEYLLCGLSVVSTRSSDGRTVFLNNKYCRMVGSRKRAIRKAIDELLSANFSPEEIRNNALKDIYPHRQRLLKVIGEILIENDIRLTIDQFWKRFYQNKMTRFKPFPKEFREEMQKAASLQEV